MKVLSLGEALVDVVQEGDSVEEHVGGSLMNVACGLARLGHDATVGAWFGKDDRGDRIVAYCEAAGAKIAEGSDGAAKTSVAFAALDENKKANYTFDLEWDLPSLNDLYDYGHIHTGSIAATLEPGGTKIVEALGKLQGATVSYDPNVRPALMGSPEEVLERIETIVSLCDVVKASDEDLAWLYGDKPLEEIMADWAAKGPALMVVTRGPDGAYAMLASEGKVKAVPQMDVEVGDTVGAGDSFMAGLISGLIDAGLVGGNDQRAKLRSAGWDEVDPALQRAVATSATTVSHNGSYAPTRDELPI